MFFDQRLLPELVRDLSAFRLLLDGRDQIVQSMPLPLRVKIRDAGRRVVGAQFLAYTPIARSRT